MYFQFKNGFQSFFNFFVVLKMWLYICLILNFWFCQFGLFTLKKFLKVPKSIINKNVLTLQIIKLYMFEKPLTQLIQIFAKFLKPKCVFKKINVRISCKGVCAKFVQNFDAKIVQSACFGRRLSKEL